MPRHPQTMKTTKLHRDFARSLLLTACLCGVGLSFLAQAAEPAAPIAWSAAQAKAAGVGTQVLAATAASPAAGLALQGTVEWPPQAIELLSAPLAGVVQQVLVSPGQRLRAGEPVARLLSPELLSWRRELLQAEAQARLTQSRLDRDEKLHAEGIIAGLRLEDSRTQNQVAQLAARERRQALQMAGASVSESLQPELTLRAAAPGTVLEVLGSPGQRLEAGMPVAKIARSGRLSIALQATTEQAQNLREGDTLAVQGCKAPARLSAIVPQLSEGNQTVKVRADFTAAEDCLRVNQFVQATVTGRAAAGKGARNGDAPGLSVPAQAVVRHKGQPHVFVRTAQGFVPTPVELGGESGTNVLVLRGLKVGDEVVVRGIAALKGAWQGLGGGEQ